MTGTETSTRRLPVMARVDAEVLRREIASRGREQQEFARLAGASEATLSHALNGRDVSSWDGPETRGRAGDRPEDSRSRRDPGLIKRSAAHGTTGPRAPAGEPVMPAPGMGARGERGEGAAVNAGETSTATSNRGNLSNPNRPIDNVLGSPRRCAPERRRMDRAVPPSRRPAGQSERQGRRRREGVIALLQRLRQRRRRHEQRLVVRRPVPSGIPRTTSTEDVERHHPDGRAR